MYIYIYIYIIYLTYNHKSEVRFCNNLLTKIYSFEVITQRKRLQIF